MKGGRCGGRAREEKGSQTGNESDGHRVEAGERMGDEKWRMERGRTLLPADRPGSGWVKRRSSTLASPPLDESGWSADPSILLLPTPAPAPVLGLWAFGVFTVPMPHSISFYGSPLSPRRWH